MFVRRRPLLGAAMLGGTAYLAGRAGQRAGYREDAQDQQLAELQQGQMQAAPVAAPASDLSTQLATLSGLLEKGTLSQAEFDAAKQKLLAG